MSSASVSATGTNFSPSRRSVSVVPLSRLQSASSRKTVRLIRSAREAFVTPPCLWMASRAALWTIFMPAITTAFSLPLQWGCVAHRFVLAFGSG